MRKIWLKARSDSIKGNKLGFEYGKPMESLVKAELKVRKATGKHMKMKPCRLADNTSDEHPQKHVSLYQINI